MAQQVQVSFVDDLDGSDAEGTVSFSLDRTEFEIDLSEGNAARLRDVLAPYVGAARRAAGSGRSGRAPRPAASRPAASREDTKAVRDWALAQGMTISARGRISSEVRAAYENRDVAPAAPATAEDAPKKPRARAKAPAATFISAK
jgi:hypothetical protein